MRKIAILMGVVFCVVGSLHGMDSKKSKKSPDLTIETEVLHKIYSACHSSKFGTVKELSTYLRSGKMGQIIQKLAKQMKKRGTVQAYAGKKQVDTNDVARMMRLKFLIL